METILLFCCIALSAAAQLGTLSAFCTSARFFAVDCLEEDIEQRNDGSGGNTDKEHAALNNPADDR